MNLVLDTNIIISAIVFGGKPRIVFELIVVNKMARGITSQALLDELIGVLKEKFKYSKNELVKIEKLVEENFVIINPKTVPNIIKKDPFDNQVLALADEAKVDYIISGDNHLLKTRHYKNIPIITPHYFVDKILKV